MVNGMLAAGKSPIEVELELGGLLKLEDAIDNALKNPSNSSDEEMFKRAAANAGLDISKSEELEGARQLLMNPESVQMDAEKNKDYFLRQALKLRLAFVSQTLAYS